MKHTWGGREVADINVIRRRREMINIGPKIVRGDFKYVYMITNEVHFAKIQLRLSCNPVFERLRNKILCMVY
jgi:hypothetical protein